MPRKQPVTEQNKKRHTKISYTYWKRNFKQTNKRTNEQQSDGVNKRDGIGSFGRHIGCPTSQKYHGNVAENWQTQKRKKLASYQLSTAYQREAFNGNI